ncbi:MAG: tRNA pseudouridine(38-40) synthase TruA [Flexistipes sinusarabici]|uniref:tRNA pseudouridine synthase A n=1 Tax=Flexistipes sinusarabici TaxID=2352 RepID=A0A5D0MQ03_FLESI|nr:tRNA pseudouridine(38-40) synthase TruA [Flexistipes sinusarabici]TYB33763.1 MAG: tRNA pseudouridine(38-40) synthase TruA [Flexistipes sinusarabici]
MYNVKCTVEYDGTFFAGWQIQKNSRTVQAEIEKALSKMYKTHIKITGSGRTDSGVHALSQVFNYHTPAFIPENSITAGLNSLTSDDIVIKTTEYVPTDFHATKSAASKTYEYIILNTAKSSAFYRNHCWHISEYIAPAELKKILKLFEGTHDFSSFCKKRSIVDNPVRIIHSTNVRQTGDFLKIEINADGFLHNMVRNIVGTALHVYRKKLNPEIIKEIFNAKDRSAAGPTAPAKGLYLKKVYY